MIENGDTRVIDASTAHRTAAGWVYGFPELNPRPAGTHSDGETGGQSRLSRHRFYQRGLPPGGQRDAAVDYPLSCFSLTGYSGGGKKMIAQYEGADKGEALVSPPRLRPEPVP